MKWAHRRFIMFVSLNINKTILITTLLIRPLMILYEYWKGIFFFTSRVRIICADNEIVKAGRRLGAFQIPSWWIISIKFSSARRYLTSDGYENFTLNMIDSWASRAHVGVYWGFLKILKRSMARKWGAS